MGDETNLYVSVEQERYETLLDCESRLDILADFIADNNDIEIETVCLICGFKALAREIKRKKKEYLDGLLRKEIVHEDSETDCKEL